MTKKKKKTDAKSQKAKVDGTLKEVKKGKTILPRGKIFEGVVIRKFPKRITIEFERNVYVPKYERYAASKTKIHARLPKAMEKEIKMGDTVQVQECRPLSKIIHFIVTKKIKAADKEETKK